jgi:hypothetical protein
MDLLYTAGDSDAVCNVVGKENAWNLLPGTQIRVHPPEKAISCPPTAFFTCGERTMVGSALCSSDHSLRSQKAFQSTADLAVLLAVKHPDSTCEESSLAREKNNSAP